MVTAIGFLLWTAIGTHVDIAQFSLDQACRDHQVPTSKAIWVFGQERPDQFPSLAHLRTSSGGLINAFEDNRGPSLFVCERTSRDGRIRLVIVELKDNFASIGYPALRCFCLKAHPVVRDGLLRIGYIGTCTSYSDHLMEYFHGNLQPPRFGEIELFAGVPDPVDHSRFTIECRVRGERFYLVGHLVDLPSSDAEHQRAVVTIDCVVVK